MNSRINQGIIITLELFLKKIENHKTVVGSEPNPLYLDLSNKKINGKNPRITDLIFEVLAKIPADTIINLSGNSLDHCFAKKLSQIIPNLSPRVSINLSKNKINDAAAFYIAYQLYLATPGFNLNLSENAIKNSGVTYLIDGLNKINTTSLHVKLCGNPANQTMLANFSTKLANKILLTDMILCLQINNLHDNKSILSILPSEILFQINNLILSTDTENETAINLCMKHIEKFSLFSQSNSTHKEVSNPKGAIRCTST